MKIKYIIFLLTILFLFDFAHAHSHTSKVIEELNYINDAGKDGIDALKHAFVHHHHHSDIPQDVIDSIKISSIFKGSCENLKLVKEGDKLVKKVLNIMHYMLLAELISEVY